MRLVAAGHARSPRCGAVARAPLQGPGGTRYDSVACAYRARPPGELVCATRPNCASCRLLVHATGPINIYMILADVCPDAGDDGTRQARVAKALAHQLTAPQRNGTLQADGAPLPLLSLHAALPGRPSAQGEGGPGPRCRLAWAYAGAGSPGDDARGACAWACGPSLVPPGGGGEMAMPPSATRPGGRVCAAEVSKQMKIQHTHTHGLTDSL